MKHTQLTISRYTGDDLVKRENWKDLISALVLAGYEVYGDEDKIIFNIGYDDEIKEVEE